jgi:hypothetical protein
VDEPSPKSKRYWRSQPGGGGCLKTTSNSTGFPTSTGGDGLTLSVWLAAIAVGFGGGRGKRMGGLTVISGRRGCGAAAELVVFSGRGGGVGMLGPGV